VVEALEWLRLNHSDYVDIQISHENAMQYKEDMPLFQYNIEKMIQIKYQREQASSITKKRKAL